MTGPINFRTGFRPVRRDKLIQEHVHDTYKMRSKLPEPTVCPDCGAVFHKGHWQWLPRPENAHIHLCPACQRTRDKFPAGFVTLAGDFLARHRDEIFHLVRNHADKARRERPLERIMAIEEHDSEVLITTTDIHLARGIGEALESAYGGTLEFHYNEGQHLLRVHWERDSKAQRGQ